MQYRTHQDAEAALDHMRKDMDGTIRVLNAERRANAELRERLAKAEAKCDNAKCFELTCKGECK